MLYSCIHMATVGVKWLVRKCYIWCLKVKSLSVCLFVSSLDWQLVVLTV